MFFLKVIGLCGGSGAGKGFVGKMFSERGFAVIDTDAVYHRLVSEKSPCLDELVENFGEGILGGDGSLNRGALAAIAFSTPELSRRLNEVTHKHVLGEVRKIIAGLPKSARGVLVDAPMLFESGFDKECDTVIGVIAPREIRLFRIMQRDGISRERAEARISAQLSDDKIENMCSYVIYNDGEADLTERVDEICKTILK